MCLYARSFVSRPSVTSPRERLSLGQHDRFKAASQLARQNFESLLRRLADRCAPTDPAALDAFERELQAELAQSCGDVLTAAALQVAHEDLVTNDRTKRVRDSIPHLRLQRSRKPVKVVFLGGSVHELETPYDLRRPPRGPGRPRRRGRRGRPGNGKYPVLAALGIHYRVTPAVAMEVARLVCMSTYKEAQETLAQRGLKLDVDAVAGLAHKLARRGLNYRTRAIERARKGFRATGVVGLKRLVISTDGGRLRTRKNKKGKRRKSGRHGFVGDWKEPKVLAVYEIDARGKLKTLLRYDATLGDCNDLFAILTAVLCELGAHEAAEWIVIGDGADWIWNRVDKLVQDLGYDERKVTRVVDFYHAIDNLSKILDLVKGWTKEQRRKWSSKARALLKAGKVEDFLEMARPLCRGRNAKEIGTAIAYYEKRAYQMRYDVFRRMNIPLGSGVIESAVRRIVNLRLKGSSIFWKEEHAEGLLHLRAQLLSGRWTDYVHQILEPEAFWGVEAAA